MSMHHKVRLLLYFSFLKIMYSITSNLGFGHPTPPFILFGCQSQIIFKEPLKKMLFLVEYSWIKARLSIL